MLIQFIMCGPILACFPWAVLMGIGTVYFAFLGESHGFSKNVGYGLGWLGLLGLIATILLPAAFYEKRKWLRWSATLLIACGYLATVAILLEPSTSGSSSSTELWWKVWLLGGPVIVGAWNVARIWKRPHKSEQTTPGDGTARPGAGASPCTSLSEL